MLGLFLIYGTDVEPVSPLEADVMAAERRDWLAPGGAGGRFRPQEAVSGLLGLFFCWLWFQEVACAGGGLFVLTC